MDQELAQIIRDLVAEFPCCQDINPRSMNKSQSAAHGFLFHLGWGNKEFSLKEAIVNWNDSDYKVFLGLLDDYRELIRS
ncbi:MAG: hypothetical protein AB8G05_18480 [Oligoflexales bacterium]